MVYADPVSENRIKKGELKTIRADVTMHGRFKKPEIGGRMHLTVRDSEGGMAIIVIPDKCLSDFATAALQTIHAAKEPERNMSGGPTPMIKARPIVPDQLSLLDPIKSGAAPGHAVLGIWIGGVSLQFSAHAETWKEVLRALTENAAPSASRQ